MRELHWSGGEQTVPRNRRTIPPMYELQYILRGVRVASLSHADTLECARTSAEDGVRRDKANHARIVHNETKSVEVYRATFGPLESP